MKTPSYTTKENKLGRLTPLNIMYGLATLFFYLHNHDMISVTLPPRLCMEQLATIIWITRGEFITVNYRDIVILNDLEGYAFLNKLFKHTIANMNSNVKNSPTYLSNTWSKGRKR